jgi:hypothetical protein
VGQNRLRWDTSVIEPLEPMLFRRTQTEEIAVNR